MESNTPDRPAVTPDCARLDDLIERQVLAEEPLSPEESAFVEAHARSCLECAALLEALEGLREAPPVPTEVLRAALDEHGRRGGSRLRAGLIAGLAAAACAAVAVLWLGRSGETIPEEPAPAAVADRTGDEPSGERAERAEQEEQEERAVYGTDAETRRIEIRPDLVAGLDRETRIAVLAPRGKDAEIALERGRVAVQLKRPAEGGLRVTTPMCSVTVTGTVFAVRIEEADVRVEVLRGAVRVDSPSWGGPTELGAGQSLTISERAAGDLDEGAREAILALLGLEETPEGARAGASPDAAPDAEPADRGSGETGAAARGAAGRPAQASSPGDLIRVARDLRLGGDWRGAAEAYRRVIDLYPGRPEASTVLVPLAEIEIGHLGRPDLALAHYQRYRRRNPAGPLAEEALYGECMALRALGDTAREARSLEEFLRAFPGSVRAPAASSRLAGLRRSGP